MLFNQRWKEPDLESRKFSSNLILLRDFWCVVDTNVRSKTNSRSDTRQRCHYRHVDLIEPKLK